MVLTKRLIDGKESQRHGSAYGLNMQDWVSILLSFIAGDLVTPRKLSAKASSVELPYLKLNNNKELGANWNP